VKTIYLGLGSNLEDKEANLRYATEMLAPEIKVTKTSKVYETEPMYIEDQPKFLNMVVAATTELLAKEVFEKIKSIEKEMGEHEHNEPRIIDIDLLFYGSEIINTPELTVPHPKIAERQFVLEPMADIAPEFIHPVLNVTIAELLKT
jgi:2-amino-4-hydroxy-6-hydroxymethyldihydropteridine diphosphokinase